MIAKIILNDREYESEYYELEELCKIICEENDFKIVNGINSLNNRYFNTVMLNKGMLINPLLMKGYSLIGKNGRLYLTKYNKKNSYEEQRQKLKEKNHLSFLNNSSEIFTNENISTVGFILRDGNLIGNDKFNHYLFSSYIANSYLINNKEVAIDYFNYRKYNSKDNNMYSQYLTYYIVKLGIIYLINGELCYFDNYNYTDEQKNTVKKLRKLGYNEQINITDDKQIIV